MLRNVKSYNGIEFEATISRSDLPEMIEARLEPSEFETDHLVYIATDLNGSIVEFELVEDGTDLKPYFQNNKLVIEQISEVAELFRYDEYDNLEFFY